MPSNDQDRWEAKDEFFTTKKLMVGKWRAQKGMGEERGGTQKPFTKNPPILAKKVKVK